MTVGDLRQYAKNFINNMGMGLYPVLIFLTLMSIMLVEFTILLWPYSAYMYCVAFVFFYVVGRARKWAKTDDTKIVEGEIDLEE